MTQEEKQLLFIDLCARLPYGVIVKENDGVNEKDNKLLDIDMFDGCINYDYIIEDIKPYLRPMSSMTEEEIKELGDCVTIYDQVDIMLSHHLDCRGLIEKGLALEAPEGMYESKNNI